MPAVQASKWLGVLRPDLWQVGQASQTTPEVVVLAAFHAFLARTNNQEVTNISLQPSALHALLEDHPSAGSSRWLTVPCPTLESNSTIATHVQQFHESVLQSASTAGQQQHVPCQAAVALDSQAAADGVSSSVLGLALLLHCSDSGSAGHAALVAELVYDATAFCEAAADLMASHLQVFMSQLTPDATTPSQPLLHTPLMTETEQQLVLQDFNSTQHTYDPSTLAHQLFAQHAAKNPDKPCVIFDGRHYTYAEIDAAANRIANYLCNNAGVEPGDIVGVLVLRSPLMVAALLAVLKTGCGYLPLDHHHPEARIEFMLQDAEVKAVITQPDLLPKLPTRTDLHALTLHPEKGCQCKPGSQTSSSGTVQAEIGPGPLGAAAAESAEWQLGQLGDANTTCYIIYTSGSTGKPKGVVVLHQGLTAYTAWFRSHFGITSSDVFLQKTPTNFDASVDELWTSLTAGATLVVAPPEAHRDVHSIMTLIDRHHVTTASAVPSQVQLLAREILSSRAAAGKALCASLKRVLSGGEALTITMAREIKAALPNSELYNTYGPTETTVGITVWAHAETASSTASTAPSTVPIGRGIHNSWLYVLDPLLQPVPVGVPGQLYISGVQVAAGYLNRKDLTGEVFLPNPFCEAGPEGPNSASTHTAQMYRTGDLVRWLPGQHACMEFLGRVDHQIKLRGFRIELQEVEAALGALPGVRQAVTGVVQHVATGQDHLVAWLSPKDLEPVSLVQQLHSSLPEYMIPTAVVLLDQLPLLVCEKVDRKSLPQPNFATDLISLTPAPPGAAAHPGTGPPDSSSGSGSQASASSELLAGGANEPLALFVAAVWAEVLGLPLSNLPAACDDFFALGGNSLLAGRMNSTLRAGLQLPEMSGMLIYQHPTLAAFVGALAGLAPAVPSWPGMALIAADPAAAASLDASKCGSYFSELRSNSYASLSTSSMPPSSFAEATGSSLGGSRPSSRASSFSSVAQLADPRAASAVASCSGGFPDAPQLATVFSGVASADNSSSPFMLAAGQQQQHHLSGHSNDTLSHQHLPADAQLPMPSAAAAAQEGFLLGKLPRAFSSERLCMPLRTLRRRSDADLLPFSTVDNGKKQASSSAGGLSALAKLSALSTSSFSKASPDKALPARAHSTPTSTGHSTAHNDTSQGTKSALQLHQIRPSLALSTAVQCVAVCVTTGLSAMLGLAPMLASMYQVLETGWRGLALLPAFQLGAELVLAVAAIAGKWLLVGRYKEREAPLWGTFYLRHWTAHLFVEGARQSFVPLIRRTNLLNAFYRALGVKIGRNVVIDTDDLLGYDCISLQDDCILDAACGVSAITYAAGKPGDKYPLGTMTVRAVTVGQRGVVGPNAVVTPGHVKPDAVVLPCSATSNPLSVWSGSTRPTHGPEASAAVKTQDPAFGVLAGLAALWITHLLILALGYPLTVAYWYFFEWLASPSHEQSATDSWAALQDGSRALACWMHGIGSTADTAAQDAACNTLMEATVWAMLVLPVTLLITGQLLVVLVIPFKWLLKINAAASGLTPAAPRTWCQRFRHHLQQCILDHPAVRAAAFLWTGTALFNAWLRALGAKVGKQAWIGEDLHLAHHDLVEIGDAVSICSGVSLLPSAALGAAKIRIMGGADVTNQTALYPGVTVKPGAVLGVFTYAEAGRTFPRYSITQGPLVLSPGQPDPVKLPSPGKPPKAPQVSSVLTFTKASSPIKHTGHSPAKPPAKPAPVAAVYRTASPAAPDEPEPSEARLVSWQQYWRFNCVYICLMCVVMPLHAAILSAPFAVVTTVLLFKLNVLAAVLLAPVASGLQVLLTMCWMAVLKRILLPSCTGSHPFYTYTHTAWMVAGLLLYYQWGALVRYISGSQLAVWYYRLLGARIGSNVLLNGLHSQEPDCLTIGDGTVIDEMTFIQAHTVENRCLKFHEVVVGQGVTIGCGSCVLPGCHISDGASLGDVSLLMKGETMPPCSVWKGVPAVPCAGSSQARHGMA